MEREAGFRNKISWFTFIFSVLVVWVHSVNGELFLGQSEEAVRVTEFERFLGSTIGQTAVPGFFMMSGYLFYRNFCWENLGRKWGSRIRTVLVPFFLWNGIYYLGYVIGSRLPVVADIVGKGKVPFDWYTAVEALIHYTYNYVFWYLYQLILLILLAPVLYGILKHRIIGAAALVLSFIPAWKGTAVSGLNLDALFYYSLAAYGGIHGKRLIEGGRSEKKAAAGMLMIAAALFMFIAGQPEAAGQRVCFRALMPIGLWLIIEERKLPQVRWWMTYNFFLYAVHFALVRLINKTAARFFSGYWPLPVVLFLLMPAIMVCFCVITGPAMKRRFPKLWFLLNGGR